MKPIDIMLMAVTAGVALMALSFSRKAAASNTIPPDPYANWMYRPQEQNLSTYYTRLESQATKNLTQTVVGGKDWIYGEMI